MRFKTVSQISEGDVFCNRYRVEQVALRTESKIVFRAKDRYEKKRVLLVIELKENMFQYPGLVLHFLKKDGMDLNELPLAKISVMMGFEDAAMVVMEDEGPLASELVRQTGKVSRNEALSVCLSLLYCLEKLAEKGCSVMRFSCSDIIWNTKRRVVSKALFTCYSQVYHFSNASYVNTALIQLVYILFDLWATDLGDVYKLSLRQIEQKYAEFSELIDYVLISDELDEESDLGVVRNLLERLIL